VVRDCADGDLLLRNFQRAQRHADSAA
jgi:hypothetical protein